MESPPTSAAQADKQDEWRELFKTLVYAVLIAVVFRSLLFEPFHIPSGSMKSTLLEGDYLFITKYSYGYGRYSFPFGLIPFKGRVFENAQPQRGDIIVFRPPGDTSTDYIKRLIGLPGDRIQVKDGLLYINGTPVKKEYVDDWTDTDPDAEGGHDVLKRFRETLPEGKSYLTLYEPVTGSMENTDEYTVPPEHYFMMGDNRDHSADSRFQGPHDKVRYVPEENLEGRADFILFSWSFSGGFHLRGDRFCLVRP